VRADDGEICFDERATLSHRGAWICANKSCLDKAFTKKILFKGERVLPVNQEYMLTSMREVIKRGALAGLGLTKRLGKIEVGTDAVKRLIAKGEAQAIIFAKDLSLRSEDDIRKATMTKQITVIKSPLMMDDIGSSLGRNKTGVVALMESRITTELLARLGKLRELES